MKKELSTRPHIDKVNEAAKKVKIDFSYTKGEWIIAQTTQLNRLKASKNKF